MPLIIRSRAEEATRVLEESIAELADDHAELSLTMRADLIESLLHGSGGERLAQAVEDLRNFAPDLAGATLGERLALQAIAIASAMGMDTAPVALELAMTALGGEKSMREVAAIGFPLSWACAAAAIAGDPAGALASYAGAIDEMRKRGSTFGIGQALGTVVLVRLSRGELVHAEGDLTQMAAMTDPFPIMRVPGSPSGDDRPGARAGRGGPARNYRGRAGW